MDFSYFLNSGPPRCRRSGADGIVKSSNITLYSLWKPYFKLYAINRSFGCRNRFFSKLRSAFINRTRRIGVNLNAVFTFNPFTARICHYRDCTKALFRQRDLSRIYIRSTFAAQGLVYHDSQINFGLLDIPRDLVNIVFNLRCLDAEGIDYYQRSNHRFNAWATHCIGIINWHLICVCNAILNVGILKTTIRRMRQYDIFAGHRSRYCCAHIILRHIPCQTNGISILDCSQILHIRIEYGNFCRCIWEHSHSGNKHGIRIGLSRGSCFITERCSIGVFQQ